MPRPSPVRDALKTLFLKPEHQAWSLEELVERVRGQIGAGDYSTVFRAVAVFEREGLIERVDLGDGLARYEARRNHHEHVRCDDCGRVAEVPGCALESAGQEIEATTGFRLRGHSLVFSGVCPDCAARH
ncbi:MAG: Fur family transcriptional regulator [Candidatus Dormibacterales bacterium]